MHSRFAHPAAPLHPVFLPLTCAAVPEAPVELRAARAAAAGCWFALLGGCDSADRHHLPRLLDALTGAASERVERRGGADDLRDHRRRVGRAQQRILDAVQEGDGAEYAEAFADYDQVIASALASGGARASAERTGTTRGRQGSP
ncbi:hypothetical protein [Allosaccharopolyspora coralli]|uniref:hypothetical protein n=1 Tax=Allosaccharopolyspora coralli TaxID=2665642 RepID=UPI00165248AD|nr:hypothetical protein [Allosaccharopolyspora coralli]